MIDRRKQTKKIVQESDLVKAAIDAITKREGLACRFKLASYNQSDKKHHVLVSYKIKYRQAGWQTKQIEVKVKAKKVKAEKLKDKKVA